MLTEGLPSRWCVSFFVFIFLQGVAPRYGAVRALSTAGKPSLPLQTKLFINNEFVDAVDGKTFQTMNPATEEVLAEVAEAHTPDVDIGACLLLQVSFVRHYEET